MTSLLAISFWNDVPVGLFLIKIHQGLAILFKTKAKNLMIYKALHSKNCLRFLTYIHTDQNPDFFFFFCLHPLLLSHSLHSGHNDFCHQLPTLEWKYYREEMLADCGQNGVCTHTHTHTHIYFSSHILIKLLY